MNSLWTVMSFTMRTKLRNKAFLITTAVLAILLVVVGNLPTLLSKLDSDKATKVGYVQGVHDELIQGLTAFYAGQEKPQVQLIGGASEDALKDSLEDGDIKGFVTFADNPTVGFPDATYHAKSSLNSGTAQSITVGLQVVKNQIVLKELNPSEEQLKLLTATVTVSQEQVRFTNDAGKTPEEEGTAIGLTYVLIILLFMAVMITGQLIATEITAEKSSRVMEIIVTSVSPLKQMFGKILGTFIVGIVQMVVLVGALVLNLAQQNNLDALKDMGVDLGAIDPKLIAFAVFFYLTGFFLYATLFAAVGSIVSRTEDLGQAILPITMLTLAGFYIAVFGISQPESSVVTICSYVPFFAPFLMFLRIGLTEPSVWEVLLSVGILLASIIVIGWISAKIYRTGVLMYGKRPSLKELFKAMKAYKV
ncbi:ABC transporter permease [Cohnella panacarvi]|uniref:ABC transporter permease n=1 Tax=Cohnella panacarvi TaxID=400776 RepID=UPI00047CFE5E|nr:ABC transporter permease [Cohnella panacarvi]